MPFNIPTKLFERKLLPNSKKKVSIRASKSARKVALFASYFVERF